MQVFNSYFKVLKKYIGFMFMYIGIMCTVLSFTTAGASQNAEETYRTATTKFCVFDYDCTAESKALISYLETAHVRKEIAADDKETIQDELYMRNVENILRIPAGFGAALSDGSFLSSENPAASPEIITVPDSQAARFFETSIDNYLGMIQMYLTAGYSTTDAAKAAEEVLNQNVEVSLPDGGETVNHTKLYTCFNYLGWVFIALIISSIGPVLQVYNKKELRERIACSSYKFLNLNNELFAGVIVTGLAITAVVILISCIMLKGSVFCTQGLFFCLNALCYLFVALSLAFLASKLTGRQEILNMIANVASLGMAFLCGIFVPIEYLGSGVVKAAHFLPAYWFNQANINIDFYLDTQKPFIFLCMGVELLFAILFFIIGLITAKRQTVAGS